MTGLEGMKGNAWERLVMRGDRKGDRFTVNYMVYSEIVSLDQRESGGEIFLEREGMLGKDGRTGTNGRK